MHAGLSSILAKLDVVTTEQEQLKTLVQQQGQLVQQQGQLVQQQGQLVQQQGQLMQQEVLPRLRSEYGVTRSTVFGQKLTGVTATIHVASALPYALCRA
jgi:uncharacterized protein YllA (UPF0747 family)